MDAEKYLKERLEERIDYYEKMSRLNLSWYRRLRITEVACAALIPLFAGYVVVFGGAAVILGVLGIVVAGCAGVLGLYQFQQKWMEYHASAEALKKEKYRFLSEIAPYESSKEKQNLQLLVARTEKLGVNEHDSDWAGDEPAPLVARAGRARHGTEPAHPLAH